MDRLELHHATIFFLFFTIPFPSLIRTIAIIKFATKNTYRRKGAIWLGRDFPRKFFRSEFSRPPHEQTEGVCCVEYFCERPDKWRAHITHNVKNTETDFVWCWQAAAGSTHRKSNRKKSQLIVSVFAFRNSSVASQRKMGIFFIVSSLFLWILFWCESRSAFGLCYSRCHCCNWEIMISV